MGKTPKKTIVIVFNAMNIGGIETKIIDLCRYLSHQKKYRLFLLLKNQTGCLLKDVPRQIKIISPNFPNYLKLKNLIFPFWLSHQFRQIKPNLIITFGNFCSIAGAIGKKISFSQTNLIISEDSSIIQQIESESFPKIRQFLIKLTYPLARKIIVLSPAGKNKLKNIVPTAKSKIIIRPNWLPFRFTQMIKPSKKPKDIDILFMARLENQKNPVRFLKIISQITKTKKNLKIYLVGSGSLEPMIKRYITKNQLQKQIILKPFTLNPADYYQRSKIFLISSDHEGFPLTVLESIAAGCLPVYYSLDEINTFFNYNKYIQYNSIHQASQKILFLLSHPTKVKKILNLYRPKVLKDQKNNFIKTINEFKKSC